MVAGAIISGAIGYMASQKGIKYQERLAAKAEAEAKAAKKAALKAHEKAYRRGIDDLKSLMTAQLKESKVNLYGTAGGTATANQQRGLYRQAGQAVAQMRDQEALGRASLEAMPTFDPGLYAGIGEAKAAQMGVLSDVLGGLIEQYGNKAPSGPGSFGIGKIGSGISGMLGGLVSGATSGFGNVLSNVGNVFQDAYTNLSGLVGSMPLTIGPGKQLYYSDPVAQQSRPLSGSIGSDMSWNSYTNTYNK